MICIEIDQKWSREKGSVSAVSQNVASKTMMGIHQMSKYQNKEGSRWMEKMETKEEE